MHNYAKQWLRHLFLDDDIVELRAFRKHHGTGPARRHWFTLAETDEALARAAVWNAEGYDIYCGVCPRTERGKGEAEHAQLARAVWLDFDDKPGGDYYTADEVHAAIARAGLPAPSMLANSGHGVHAFWRLSAPADAGDVEAILLRFAPRPNTGLTPVVPEADPKSTDRARILRLPGFTNWKPPVAETSVLAGSSERHDLAVFAALAEQAPDAPTAAAAETAPPPPARKHDYKPRTGATRQCSPFERAEKWIAKRDPAVQGQGGDEHTFVTACALVRGFRLTDDEALSILRDWNRDCSPPWTDAGLREKIRSARKNGKEPFGYLLDKPLEKAAATPPSPAPAGEPAAEDERNVVANYRIVGWNETQRGKSPITAAVHINDIAECIFDRWRDDMGRVGGNLFHARDNADGGEIATFVGDANALFAWLHAQHDAVMWKDNGLDAEGVSFVSRGMFFARVLQEATPYLGVSAYPFEPARPEMFTRWNAPTGYAADGKRLAEFVEFFNPATDVDADLLVALVLTLFWGGPPGGRPLFVIAPEEAGSQQGIGKTKLAELASALVGGYMDLAPPKRGKFADALAKQALEEVNLPYRVGLIDNHTGVVRDDDFTRLITAPKIGGRASFAKQGERANLITWIITTNEPSFSTDIACRTALLRLKPCDRERSPDWLARVRAFLAAHGREVASDCLALLGSRDKARVARHTRFVDWDLDVLGCLQHPDAVVTRMLESQQSADTDASEIREFLYALADEHPGTPHRPVELKIGDLVTVWNKLHAREFSPQQVAQQIKNAGARGALASESGEAILEHRKRNGRMVWLWSPCLLPVGEDGEDEGRTAAAVAPRPSPDEGFE